MKKRLFVLISVLGFFGSYGQTTVIFKPNATVGKDASILRFDNNCIGTGDSITPANMNYGLEQIMSMKDWTWNAVGCTGGTMRSLLCFTELNTIPSNAVILSAELRLFGTNLDRNTSYSGAPSSFYSNEVIVQEVTSAWDENTVTWNTAPTTTTTNQFTIPASTSEYNWNYTNNSNELVAMVQNMVSGNNYGFMLKLQTEAHYRNMVFASSDHSNADLHPELVVTYEVCNAHFSYCVANTGDDTLQYTFSALNQDGTHVWKFGLTQISTASSFTYGIPNGAYNSICHEIITEYDTCEYCMKLCSSYAKETEEVYVEKEEKNAINSYVSQGSVPPSDEYIEPQIQITPNPTKTSWNVSLQSMVEEEVEIVVFDMNGNKLCSQREYVEYGKNDFKVDCSNCLDAVYLLSIKGNTISFESKVVKER